ncbi:MAG: carboxypeptidase regulatory-like domain-containing protein [Planctomycetota bacterium]
MSRLFAVLLVIAAALLAVAAALFMETDTAEAREANEANVKNTNDSANNSEVLLANNSRDANRTSADSLKTTESKPASAPAPVDLSNAVVIVRGFVFDSEKKPIANAEVSVVHRGSNSSSTLQSHTAPSAPDGTFVVGVPDRDGWDWRVEVRSPGFATSYLTNIPAWLGDIDVGAIVLYPSLAVRGKATNRDGAPLAGAKIYAMTIANFYWDEDFSEEEKSTTEDIYKPVATTAADGTYSIAKLPPGKVTLGAESPGYADSVRPGVLLGAARPNTVDFSLASEDPLNGLVVDESGSPLAKSLILATLQDQKRAFWRKPVESDAQGKFTVVGLDRTRRNLNLRITKSGYSSVWQDGSSLPADEKYTLRKSTFITLKAESPPGSPAPVIRSIRIERRRTNNRWSGAQEVQKFQREIVASNIWKFTTDQRGPVRAIVAGDNGITGTSSEFEISQNMTDLEIVAQFDRPGSLAGRVVKADMSPVADVRVEVTTEKTNQYSLKVATTKEDGTFTFDSIAAGTVSLKLRSKDWISNPTKTDVRTGEKTEGVEIVAVKPSKISGKLTIGGAAPGEPVAISFYKIDYYDGRPVWNMIATSSTGVDGMYSMSPVPSGRIALVPNHKVDPQKGSIRSFEDERSHPEWGDQESQNWQWIADVPPEGERVYDLDVPAPKFSYIKGSITINGEPRSGLELWTYLLNGGGEWQSDSSDAEGKFKIRVAKAGEYQLQLSGDGFQDYKKVSIGEGDEREVEFVLSSGGVEGSVADTSGRAVAARVRLEKQRERNSGNSNEYYGWWDAPELLTKADGSYVFPEIPAGNYKVIVTDPKRKLASIASAVFTVGMKERYQVPQLRVPLEALLIVFVKSPDGKPVQGNISVKAAPNSEPLGQKRVQAWIQRGAVRFRAMRPGPVIVKYIPNGGPYLPVEQTVTLQSDGSPTNVILEVKKKDAANPAGGASPVSAAGLSGLGYVSNSGFSDSNGMEEEDYDNWGWNSDYEYIGEAEAKNIFGDALNPAVPVENK